MDSELKAKVDALRARREARGMADPLNRLRAVMAESSAPVILEKRAPFRSAWRVTWERVTPESAEHGDAEARGFVDRDGFRSRLEHKNRDYALTLREALEAVKESSPTRASLSYVEASDSVASGARWITWGFSPDYSTGDSLSLSLHIPETVSGPSRARLVRLISIQERNRL